ncbi:MAG: phage/plasmid primase, P4 family [Pyrinomonadaceae bacterium]
MGNNNQNQPITQIDLTAIRSELIKIPAGEIGHENVFSEILENLSPIDFEEYANLEEKERVSQKLKLVLTIQAILQTAKALNCGLCRNLDFLFAYNGAYWKLTDSNELENFLADCAKVVGVDWLNANYYRFRRELLKQFWATAYLPTPKADFDKVLINLRNGTFEIKGSEKFLRPFDRNDFLTYQLEFDFDENADFRKWQLFLDEVLPEREKQIILSEFMGYVFARHLKLEKTLLLFGSGANGKSVVFNVIKALFGPESISHFSLESLGHEYHRAKIANKLLNYSSDISFNLKADIFKILTSGEPVEARLPYGQPMVLDNYARLMFNSNHLPRDVEHSHAYFRRFLIIPFEVTISEEHQNKHLAKEIVETELSGVFNWMLEGLERLLKRGNFSECKSSENALNQYKLESDSVAMFLKEENFRPSTNHTMTIAEIFAEYREYARQVGLRPLGRNNFAKRLESNGIARFDSSKPHFLIEKF